MQIKISPIEQIHKANLLDCVAKEPHCKSIYPSLSTSLDSTYSCYGLSRYDASAQVCNYCISIRIICESFNSNSHNTILILLTQSDSGWIEICSGFKTFIFRIMVKRFLLKNFLKYGKNRYLAAKITELVLYDSYFHYPRKRWNLILSIERLGMHNNLVSSQVSHRDDRSE